ncbi:MAG: cytochrome c biogenesis protein CcsA [Gammaproteobacteria bacterium]
MTINLISALAIILYTVTGILLGVRLSRVTTTQSTKLMLIALGLSAVLLHGIALYSWIITPRGLNLGFFNATSLITWFIALLLLLTSLTKPVINLGIVLLPLAALTIVLEIMFPSNHLLFMQAGFDGLDAHILISIMAASLITIAAVQAGLLAIQDAHLHEKHPGGFIRALPPLQTGETLLFQIIAMGFVLLTAALISGAIFLENIFAQHLVHKTVLSIIAWLVFGILLWGRWRFGWRGRTAIRWTLAGFFALMLAYFGSKLVLEIILGR